MESTYARLYPAGRVDVAADAPPEYRAIVKESLRTAIEVQIVMTPERFLETLLLRKVPESLARSIVESAFVLDDQAYLSERSGS